MDAIHLGDRRDHIRALGTPFRHSAQDITRTKKQTQPRLRLLR
jgi:hypothetical protein